MFSFTTQTIFNTTGFIKQPDTTTYPESGSTPDIRIGNVRLNSAQIDCVEKKVATPAYVPKVTFDLTKFVAPDLVSQKATLRFKIYLGLSMDSQDSWYANAFVYKGKPLYIEIPVTLDSEGKIANPEKVADKIPSIAKKYMLFESDQEFLKVIPDASNTAASGDDPAIAKVTFEGISGYQQIRAISLQYFSPEVKNINCCGHEGEFVDAIVGVPVIYKVDSTYGVVSKWSTAGVADGEATLTANRTAEPIDPDTQVAIYPGLEAFGDYDWMIHNLRLPSDFNTSFWTGPKEDFPSVGATYTQYIVTMKTDNVLNKAGEGTGMAITEITKHVFYVNDTLTSDKSDLDSFFSTKSTKADTKFADPYEDVDEPAWPTDEADEQGNG